MPLTLANKLLPIKFNNNSKIRRQLVPFTVIYKLFFFSANKRIVVYVHLLQMEKAGTSRKTLAKVWSMDGNFEIESHIHHVHPITSAFAARTRRNSKNYNQLTKK